ncbi:hypothetical protein L249_6218 [Ophiocordyceps polyrhachis-furcata BCC 54312]|uniref:Uncharacterized protein n=1 Tax=Ophiocordyceps polyrhachis-furcata BCC 54312 TaxID=1330021 RepID=A0A367L0X1_9HYPO|nr:hypothetical protein L249_6218 [Ophiocordyceps polyrhachis-furcata BCC 54312]
MKHGGSNAIGIKDRDNIRRIAATHLRKARSIRVSYRVGLIGSRDTFLDGTGPPGIGIRNGHTTLRSTDELGQGACAEPMTSTVQSQRQSRHVKTGTDGISKSASALPQIQVPASPVRRAPPPQQQKSPSRHSFGIDKSLTMREVSLKRAPTQRSGREHAASHSQGFLERRRALNVSTASSSTSTTKTVQGTQRLLSYNERLSASRTAEAARAQRQERVQKKRSNAFGIGQEEMEEYKKNAIEMSDDGPANAPTFTRQEVLSQGNLPKSMTTPNLGSLPSKSTDESDSFPEKPSDAAQAESSPFEPYSCFHLSRRILPHRVLARHVSGKNSLSLKDLLKTVKAPDYSLPDVDQDMVVFAILARKSEPRSHSHQASANKRTPEGKYMVMTLVDLKMEVELFLFRSGFTRFWKLTEGTVLAILNPTVMPPPPGRQDTGRFSLVINSDADTILEIGAARDLGFCRSLKKDGDVCGGWVNRKRTEFCEFHSNEAVRKQRSKRLEVNSGGFGGRKPDSRELRKPTNNNYDWETKTKWFASRSHSAADLIDGKNRTATDKKEREDFLRRSLEAKEREREIMRKLGRVGNAAGKEYMLMRSAGCRTSETTDVGDAPTAKGRLGEAAAISLGLHKGKDRAIHLSPIKRKRPQSSLASPSLLARPGYGWGSSLKEKLTKMREGDEAPREGKSPTRKKTRFVTDRGIREAGRDSLGKEADIGEDDELIIVG